MLTYQWLRNGAAIAGKTNTTYTLTNADVYAQNRFQISYVDGHGFTETVNSAPTNGVGNGQWPSVDAGTVRQMSLRRKEKLP